MAISTQAPGITIQILTSSRPTPEHPDPDILKPPTLSPSLSSKETEIALYQHGRTVSAYIPSITNSPFSIKMTVGAPYGGPNMRVSKLRLYVYVDGNLVWVATCGRPHFKKHAKWSEEVSGVKEGKGARCFIRDLKFAEIGIDAELDIETTILRRLAQSLKPLGKIEVKVYEENYGKQGGDTPGDLHNFLQTARTIDKVPEKALKGGDAKSHGTTLSRAQKTQRGEVWRTEKNAGEDWPLVVFRFMYRSEDSLKKLHILPTTPLPSPSPSPSPFSSPSPSPAPSPSLFIPTRPPTQSNSNLIDGLTPTQHVQLLALKAQMTASNKAASNKSAPNTAASNTKKVLVSKKRTRTGEEIKKEEKEEERRAGRAAKRRRCLTGEVVEVDLTGDSE